MRNRALKDLKPTSIVQIALLHITKTNLHKVLFSLKNRIINGCLLRRRGNSIRPCTRFVL